MKQPNILFITTDQQRWDCVHANGNDIIRTPAMDRLAAEGARFTHSYTSAAACVPSRATWITGQYPHTHGATDTSGRHFLPPGTPTLMSLLSAAGYHTVGVGKMHFFPWNELWGFDLRVTGEGYEDDDYSRMLKEKGLFGQQVGHHTPGFGDACKAVPSPLHEDDQLDGWVGKRGVDMLRERAQDPFFLWVSFNGPHEPWDPPAPYDRLYRPEDMPPRRAAHDEFARIPPSIRPAAADMGIEHIDLTAIDDGFLARIKALYYGKISHIDRWVGVLLRVLDEKGLAENTLVVFTSDHGELLGDHRLFYKCYLPCEADMRVPLLIRWPQRFKSGICNAFTGSVNLMPTLLDAAGVSIPSSCQGESLLPLLEGKQAGGPEYVVSYAEPGRYRIRDRRYAYTRYPDQTMDTLYDLERDPWELDNLCCGARSVDGILAKMRATLVDWFAAQAGRGFEWPKRGRFPPVKPSRQRPGLDASGQCRGGTPWIIRPRKEDGGGAE